MVPLCVHLTLIIFFILSSLHLMPACASMHYLDQQIFQSEEQQLSVIVTSSTVSVSHQDSGYIWKIRKTQFSG